MNMIERKKMGEEEVCFVQHTTFRWKTWSLILPYTASP